MELAGKGTRVQIHYVGRLEDGGEIFDSSEGSEPLEFVVGSGELIDGFDEAVVGMHVGQTKTVTLPPEKAYGEHSEERVIHAPRSEMPPEAEVKVGDILEVTIEGESYPAPVTAIDDESVTIDMNPPLAGQTLIFELTLAAIVS